MAHWALLLAIPASLTGQSLSMTTPSATISHQGPTYEGAPVLSFVKNFPSKAKCADAAVNDYALVTRQNPKAYYICARDVYVIANHPAPK